VDGGSPFQSGQHGPSPVQADENRGPTVLLWDWQCTDQGLRVERRRQIRIAGIRRRGSRFPECEHERLRFVPHVLEHVVKEEARLTCQADDSCLAGPMVLLLATLGRRPIGQRPPMLVDNDQKTAGLKILMEAPEHCLGLGQVMKHTVQVDEVDETIGQSGIVALSQDRNDLMQAVFGGHPDDRGELGGFDLLGQHRAALADDSSELRGVESLAATDVGNHCAWPDLEPTTQGL